MLSFEASEKNALQTSLRENYGFEAVVWGDTLGGLSSRNIAFSAHGQDFILKCYGAEARQQISRLEQIALLLAKEKYPAPLPQSTVHGDLHVALNGQIYAVFVRAPGHVRHSGELSRGALESTARTLAMLHRLGAQASQVLGPPRRPLHRTSSILPSANMLLQAGGVSEMGDGHLDLLNESLSCKRQVIEGGDYEHALSCQRGLDFVHGDFHNENLLFTKDGSVTCVLDFEESFVGGGVCDVVNFVFLACCHAGFSAAEIEKSRHFVAAYRQMHPLTDSMVHAAIKRHFLAMASSTFLERRFIAGEAIFEHLLRRDITKMQIWLKDPHSLLGFLT